MCGEEFLSTTEKSVKGDKWDFELSSIANWNEKRFLIEKKVKELYLYVSNNSVLAVAELIRLADIHTT